jgi:phosphohistidine phosphatase SixA
MSGTYPRGGFVMLMHVARTFGVAALLWSVPALSQSIQTPSSEWIAVVHGATHNDQADTDPLNISDRSKQRQLNDQGRALAKSIGESMRQLKIPVGKVYTSQFYRAIETGMLLGFGEVSSSPDITEGGLVVPPMENDRRAKAFRALVAIVPPAGTNVVIVSHKPNIMDAFGKDWFDVREGEASIFKPNGSGGQTLVARVLAADWAKLGQAAEATGTVR